MRQKFFHILFVLIPPFDIFYTWAEVNIFKYDYLWKFQSLIFMEVLFCIFCMFYRFLSKTWIQIYITSTDALYLYAVFSCFLSTTDL